MLGSVCLNVILGALCGFLLWRHTRVRARLRELESTAREGRRTAVVAEGPRDDEKARAPYETQFLANVSHELRTPLNSMLILSKLLLRNQDGRLTDAQLKWVNTICKSGADLLGLIDEILDFSKTEAQAPRLALEEVSLRAIRDQVRELFQCIADEKRLEFSVEMDERTPETIRTDPVRLKQILRNLVSNALKFTSSGWVRVTFCPSDDGTAWARADDSRRGVTIRVSDSGVGIAGENQEKVFQAFRQEDTGRARRFGGIGLGLAISRRLADLLGGGIELESERGVGSTFTLHLPATIHEPVESR